MVAITRDDRDGVDVIQLDGEVDLTNADSLLAAVEATRSASVVLDLSLVAFLDSSGIRAIDRGHRHLTADGRALLHRVAPGHARRLDVSRRRIQHGEARGEPGCRSRPGGIGRVAATRPRETPAV